jgi:hypothetical protein
LIAREVEEDCVPVALIEYRDGPPAHETDDVVAGLNMQREACALHDLVARGDAAFYEVERIRRIVPGRRGALGMQCIRGAEVPVMVEATRTEWSTLPLECFGLHCRRADTAAGPTHWLFAHRISGPLRFDAIATGDYEPVLEQLRERCP